MTLTAQTRIIIGVLVAAGLSLSAVIYEIMHHPRAVALAVVFAVCVSGRSLAFNYTIDALKHSTADLVEEIRDFLIPLAMLTGIGFSLYDLWTDGFTRFLLEVAGLYVADRVVARTIRTVRARRNRWRAAIEGEGVA